MITVSSSSLSVPPLSLWAEVLQGHQILDHNEDGVLTEFEPSNASQNSVPVNDRTEAVISKSLSSPLTDDTSI